MGLPTNGLKADLVERLRKHLEEVRPPLALRIHTPNQNSSMGVENDHNGSSGSMKGDASPKSPSRISAGSSSPTKSPRNRAGSSHSNHDMSPREASTKVHLVPAKQHLGDNPSSPMPHTAAASEARPTAEDLARKRAERFGIPVYQEMKHQPMESMAEQPTEVAESPVDESPEMEDEPGAKNTPVHHEYDELLASGIPEGSIITIEDLVIDNPNFKRIQKVLELPENGGEAKIKEIVTAVVTRINTEFEGDRSKIRAPPRLATSRLTFALKQALPRAPKKEAAPKTSKNDAKDWKKGRSEWKSNDWNSKKYVDDRNGKKNRSYSYDSLESDAEEFIRRNRLDKRSAEIMRTESRGMVAYIMDQGFNLSKYENPSREVMLRVGEYRRKKRAPGGPSHQNRGRPWKKSSRSVSKSPARSRSRSYNRGRSPSRSVSYARNTYNRDSRSRSR